MPTTTHTPYATPHAPVSALHNYPDVIEVVLEQDPTTGDTMLPLPPELCERLDWQLNDELEWEQTASGFLLKNKTKLERQNKR